MSQQIAIATLEGTGHQEYAEHHAAGRIPAGSLVVVDYPDRNMHLPYSVRNDGQLFNNLLTDRGTGGPPEMIIGERHWRIQQ